MSFITLFSSTFLITLTCFSFFWLLSLLKKDAGIVDIYWGPGFAIITFFAFIVSGNNNILEVIFLLLTISWAIRLGLYISIRHNKTANEDQRYRTMRHKNGEAFWWKSYIKIFLLQAVLMWVIATPQLLVFMNDTTLKSYQVLIFTAATILFLIGFVFETIADWQLFIFKNDSKNENKTLTKGLWATSRHPNYFGEILVWWGFGFMAYSLNPDLYIFIGPALLTFLIINVSGVRLLEHHLKNEKQGYEDYMDKVPALIPSFHKLLGMFKKGPV